MKPILIIDYGMGNIGSLRNMFRRIGVEVSVAVDEASILKAEKLLLPGVGAFDAAMSRLNSTGIGAAVRHRAVNEQVPLLGICLGMQLLTDSSEEGRLPGLGIIPAQTRRFVAADDRKVPHMGWNLVRQTAPSPLTSHLEPESRFYFVHSYYVRTEDRADSILSANYGIEFDAAIQRGNVFGAQFHPEKSHRYGMALLNAFAEI